jgi:RimJ/RimL family protein N-acetyltransferase
MLKGMKTPRHEIPAKPPAALRIRAAAESDAAAMIAYMQRLTNEPHNNLTWDPGQWTMTVEAEREFMARQNGAGDHGVFVVAEIGGEMVGAAQLRRGTRPANHHAAGLGISIDAAWRRRGIGTALLAHLLAWARAHGVVRVELKVFTRNAGAIRLYERFGFVQEGRHPHAFCKQGVWVEELTMGLILPGADK